MGRLPANPPPWKVAPTRESVLLGAVTDARKSIRIASVVAKDKKELHAYLSGLSVLEKQIDVLLESMTKEFANPAGDRVTSP